MLSNAGDNSFMRVLVNENELFFCMGFTFSENLSIVNVTKSPLGSSLQATSNLNIHYNRHHSHYFYGDSSHKLYKSSISNT